MIENIRQNIKLHLETIFKFENIVVEVPKKGDSDLAIPLFGYAKLLQQPLSEVFDLFKKEIDNFKEIEEVVLTGGFLNIYLKRAQLSLDILKSIYAQKFDYGTVKEQNKTVVIDYSSPNIAKSFGVGHLRSTVIGNALKHIYQKQGYHVVGINHLGDWGTQFGRMIVAYQKWGSAELIEKNPIDELQKLYVKFHEELKLDPSLEQAGRDAFLKLEQNDKHYIELWQYFREASLKEFMEMYDLLGVSFDSYDGEAFFNDKIDAAIEELTHKRLLVEDQGAQVVFVGENYPPVLFKRSDGATLYATRDLAALLYRYQTYHFDEILYVVGNEQKLYFESLKRVTDLMGYHFILEHVNFGLILVDGKKMSTRKGRFAKLNAVLDAAIEDAKNAIEAKNPHLENADEVAKAVGIGAIIFNDLKNERHLDIEFNLENMLKFEGQTGPYLQYSVVRIFSILKQTTLDNKNLDTTVLMTDDYFDLVKLMDQFPDILSRAKETKMPSVIAKYLLTLAAGFNRFYGKVKINVSDERLKNTNVLLIQNIYYILVEGLRLLGIKHLEAM